MSIIKSDNFKNFSKIIILFLALILTMELQVEVLLIVLTLFMRKKIMKKKLVLKEQK